MDKSFGELSVGQKFRCYRWDGAFDEKGTAYMKITPMLYADKHKCNSSYVGKRGGVLRTSFVWTPDEWNVRLVEEVE